MSLPAVRNPSKPVWSTRAIECETGDCVAHLRSPTLPTELYIIESDEEDTHHRESYVRS
jgi:hypothetical protein